MSQLRYKIVFDGSLMPDTSMDTVKANLASLFKSDRARIDTLFGRGPIALKRDLAEDEADQYLTVLQRAGARARKEPDLAAALSLVETDEEKAASAPPAEQSQQPMDCPKCGHQQMTAPECSACGVIIEKYLARQAALAESTPAQPAQSASPAQHTPYTPPRANIDTQAGQVGELKVASFNGRIGRMRYLAWSLVLMFAFAAVVAALSAVALLSETLSGILVIGVSIGMLVISVQIGVQRLHDMGWTGWLWLLNLVPIVNSVFWIIMLVVPGTVGSNRFGPEPPPNSLAVNLLAGLFIVLMVGGLLTLFLSGFAILAVFGMFFDQVVSGS
ncbi:MULTISPECIES: DUF805 domain-containing protein [Pseudomonas]|uniref:Membrane protein n=2 Tax=Pseudomonadaceae TaxID=135621 RepID=A0A0D0KS91_9PSED|nr:MULTISPECIES: DUF805 domain-containing protein [Pseudomonas]KIP99847.1 membrane protein [Pseudomonas fulva]MCW2290548.1 uncharacterized membrane protein YhaH (DUF805 family) [Pseudomonas sp. BIGb0408]NYH74879.1 uncharacterized membrane protein YhaH (DUF805 family) [Pseudomonas flavescens]